MVTSQLLSCDSPRKLPEENLSPENLPQEGNYDFVASLHSDLSVADASGGYIRENYGVNADDE